MRDYLYILIIAAAVTYLFTPLVRKGAIVIKAQHAPRDRDVHEKPTPLLGGIAMYVGLAAGLLVSQRLSYLAQAFSSSRTVTGLLAAGGLLVLVGAVDDRWGLGVISRLAGQIAAGGILIWSGAYLPWIPLPGGTPLVLEPDLSYTLTILIVVMAVNAVNFIDGLDGLAAGVVAISALSYLIYSYNLSNSVGIPSESVPAVVCAVLAGICIGFLPHNFNPARVFMGDAGAYLLGMLLAYGPISSTASLDPYILVNYSQLHPLNRFPTILPLLLAGAILLIPFADLVLAVIRRTLAGKSPFAADGLHLHHRLLRMGHSQRQSVLLMYLWAALFSGMVVGLSLIRINIVWLALSTVVAVGVLLLATMPSWRPWRNDTVPRHGARGVSHLRSGEPGSATSYAAAAAHDGVPSAAFPDEIPAGGAVLDGLPAPGLPAPGLPAPGLPAPGLPSNGLPPAGLPPAGLPSAVPPPNGTHPDGTHPDGTHPDGTRPDGTHPDGTRQDGARQDGTRTRPDGVRPDGAVRRMPLPGRRRPVRP
jgi:UDP-GlcNAc:undecaprenyl-phosphate GlcNAc-1-phosphate transferase